MKIFFLKSLLIVVFATLSIYSSPDSLLVKIGSTGITAEEFQQRFELIPQVSAGIKRDLEQKKQDLLYSLIAEKLWAKNAEELKLDTTEVMRYTFSIIEKMFVRDALYKIEITDKIKIPGDEKIEGLKKIYYNLQLDLIQFSDSSAAFESYNSLTKHEAAFDSLKTKFNQHILPITIKYGEFVEPIEDELYSLQENDISKPVKTKNGWIIFKLIKKENEPISSRNQALMNVEEIIRKRKADKYYDEFFERFFKNKKIETDGKIFWSIADKITELINQKKEVNSAAEGNMISFEVSDLLRIEKLLGADTLSMNFIFFDEKPVTVKEFLRELVFDGFSFDNFNQAYIAKKLNARVRLFIEHELLAREGYKRGLHNLPDVKSSISMWKDNYMAKLLKNILLDSIKVSDEEVYNHFINKNQTQNNAITEVNIIEILTDSLEVIDLVLRELEKGADIRTLASAHTKRTWTKNNGGEFGFFPITMYGDLGRIAASMNIGELYGPIKLPEGYSIFKLIDKRESTFDSALTFQQVKEELRKYLHYTKSVKFFIDYTVELANKYGVQINEQLFNSIEVMDMNLFVYRYIGFGGRISAVPLTLPFNEWYLPWKEKQKLIP